MKFSIKFYLFNLILLTAVSCGSFYMIDNNLAAHEIRSAAFVATLLVGGMVYLIEEIL